MELPADKWRIYELDVPLIQVWRWFHEHRGQGYDVLGLLGFIWRPVKGFLALWFCSEAVAAMIGLDNPEAFDLVLLESLCKRFGNRVQ